jgi:hypothetical protein
VVFIICSTAFCIDGGSLWDVRSSIVNFVLTFLTRMCRLRRFSPLLAGRNGFIVQNLSMERRLYNLDVLESLTKGEHFLQRKTWGRIFSKPAHRLD